MFEGSRPIGGGHEDTYVIMNMESGCTKPLIRPTQGIPLGHAVEEGVENSAWWCRPVRCFEVSGSKRLGESAGSIGVRL